MTLLQFLQLQPVEPDDTQSELDAFDQDETITLSETPDEESLEAFWNSVEDDIHGDSGQLQFSDESE